MVLLTNKKPEPKSRTVGAGASTDGQVFSLPPRVRRRARSKGAKTADEEEGLRDEEEVDDDGAVVWDLGEASDDEDSPVSPRKGIAANDHAIGVGERERMMAEHIIYSEDPRESTSSDATLTRPDTDGGPYVDDEFGDWNHGKTVR